MSTLMAIDGNSLVNRAFYGTQASFMKNAEGLFTGAIFGFLNMYIKYFDEIKPTHVAVAFDVHHPTFRHEMFADYKGTRHGMPDELKMQMPVLKELLDAMNISRIEMPGFEADDILGTLSRRAEKQGMKTVILTGDRDSLQLINGSTSVMLMTNKEGELMDSAKVLERYGVEPLKLIDIKALMGDKSDNIPGVPGIGEKTACDLIKTYGSLDGVYGKISEISKPSVRTKLSENRESAYMSLKLGTIVTDVPLEMSPVDLNVRQSSEKELDSILEKLEFRGLRKKLLPDYGKKIPPASEQKAELPGLETEPEEEELSLFNYTEKEEKYIDFEGLDHEGKQLSIDIVSADRELLDVIVMAEGKEEKARVTVREGSEIPEKFIKAVRSEHIIYFTAKPFILWCIKHGIAPCEDFDDLSVGAYLLDSTRKNETPAQAIRMILGKNVPSDGNVWAEAGRALKERLKEKGMLSLYEDMEIRLVPVLAEMEAAGFKINPSVLLKEGEALDARIAELRGKIYEYAGKEFNINSPKQLGTVLFEDLGLKTDKKTKSGYSTDIDVLESIEDQHPVVTCVIEYRQNAKLKSTYIDGLLNVADGDNRVHSTFNQTVTATGRLSSTEPNLQNIPVRSELGKKIRNAFVPENENRVLIDADYSQIELRILAALSGDEMMITAFRNGFDIHAITAARVNGVPVEMVTPQMRSSAKAVNFGIVYGISVFGLARDLKISRYESKKYIDEYFKQYKDVKSYLDGIVEEAKSCGYARTLFGRIRPLPELNASKYVTRQFGERVAMNMPIQGTAADIIKIAMIKVRNALKREGLDAKLILQVHDELLIDSAKKDEEKVRSLLVQCMEEAASLAVPLKVSVSSSDVSWYYCK